VGLSFDEPVFVQYARNQNHPRPVPIRKNAIYNCTPSVIGPVWPTVDVCPCCSARDSVGECVVKCSAFAVSPSSKSFCDAESLAVLQQCRVGVVEQFLKFYCSILF
jgi:mRNA-degrading endonuclease toxin of MazEF toxin-antitoxin module